MIFKMLFFSNIFLNIDFVFAETSDIDDYINNVVYNGRNSDDNEICHYNMNKQGAICRKVIHHLKNDKDELKNNNEYQNLYMNYPAFKQSNMCELKGVHIPGSSGTIMQNSLPCHARPEMIPFGVSNEDLQYHNKIIIFPYSKKVMMIFSLNEDTNSYSLLKFYKNFEWYVLRPLNVRLFTITIPQVRENIEEIYPQLISKCSKLYSQSLNANNIVHISNKTIHHKLCKIALKSKIYANEIDMESEASKLIPKYYRNVILHMPLRHFVPNKLYCQIVVSICNGFIPGTQEITEKFGLAAISDKSVILLEKQHSPENIYNLFKYFESVELAYLVNYENY